MIWIAVVFALYLLILIGVAWFSLHPFRTPLFFSPAALGAPQEELVLTASDGQQTRAWWVPADVPVGAPEVRVPVVAILGHGYVMNRSELSALAYWLWQRGISCLLIEFRGHGRSKGVSTVGWKEGFDVAAAVEEAQRRVPNARIVLIGSSMGSAASAFAAAAGARADALILDSCYSQLVSASFGWWRFLGGPVLSWLLGPTVLLAGPMAGINPFKVDVAAALARISCPVLLLHGRCDNLALPREAERNFRALGQRGELVWFEDCGHSEFRWVQAEKFYAAVEDFLRRKGFM